ncbi:hypothetical protein [Edaphobacter flagellatus]|nr:hypothetical protein [Edaphobacter flagellatus]
MRREYARLSTPSTTSSKGTMKKLAGKVGPQTVTTASALVN